MKTITKCCQPLAVEALSADAAGLIASWFQILADPTRLRLLSILSTQREACPAGELGEGLAASQPTISHHLQTLHLAGLIEREQHGKCVYYWACPDKLAILSDYLTATPIDSGPEQDITENYDGSCS